MVPEEYLAGVQRFFIYPWSLKPGKSQLTSFSKDVTSSTPFGVLYGKNMAIKKPPQAGCSYFNYKDYYHTIPSYGGCRLLVCLDWAWSRLSYAQILGDSELFSALQEEEATGLPHPALWLQAVMTTKTLHVGMTRKERIFKHSISMIRRVLENAFGVIANRFRCLLRTQEQKPNIARI